jgi:phosphate:Na+ symporter
MLRRIFLPSILIVLGYGFWISPDFKEISAGVAIFLFGMISLEEGFKAFSGGTLEKILQKSTDKLYKSIGFGVLAWFQCLLSHFWALVSLVLLKV